MSKLIKIAAILGIAVVAIAAKQLVLPGMGNSATALSPAATASISPADMMRNAGSLPETQIDSLY